MTITAAADGSALGNPGPAGWAWYIDDRHWAAGGWPHATNNRAELTAVLELFRATAHLDDDLVVLCDSRYVINSLTTWMPGWKAKGWRKGDGKPVLNVELLQELDRELTGRRYRFEWVKGHIGHLLNEAADARARAAAEAYQLGRPVPSGPGFGGRPVLAPGDAASEVLATAATRDEDREVAGAAPRAEAPAGANDGDAESIDDAPDGALFDLEEPGLHEVTVFLTDSEHARLVGRARDAGLSVEELLRSLI